MRDLLKIRDNGLSAYWKDPADPLLGRIQAAEEWARLNNRDPAIDDVISTLEQKRLFDCQQAKMADMEVPQSEPQPQSKPGDEYPAMLGKGKKKPMVGGMMIEQMMQIGMMR